MWKPFRSTMGQQGDTTLIAAGAIVEGAIRFSGILELEGRVNGNIESLNDERAVVRILHSGHVAGNVRAPLIVVDGAVTGNIHASEHIELAAHAVVNGDVHYNLIEMVKGAQVNGRLLFNNMSIQESAGFPSPDPGDLPPEV